MLTDLNLPEGACTFGEWRVAAWRLYMQPQLVPGVFVVDIGVAQRLLKMPDQLSRLLIGASKARRAPLGDIAGDQLRLVEPDACGERPRTPHRPVFI